MTAHPRVNDRIGNLLHRSERIRRSNANRPVLAVIPNVNDLSVSLRPPLHGINTVNGFRSRVEFSSKSLSSSPDELVIQKRGRRNKPIIWSPENDGKRNYLFNYNSKDKTPEKNPDISSPFVLREKPSIKKKLDLSTFDEKSLVTPDKKVHQPVAKQFNGSDVINGLKGLSNDQLINMINDLIIMDNNGNLNHDGVKLYQVVMKIMPQADINPLIHQLNIHRQNIYGTLVSPNQAAYLCAFMHLNSFQKTLVEHGDLLLQSQHWNSLMEYVFTAWNIVKDLPQWDNGDNTAQKCFSRLTFLSKQAILSANFQRTVLEQFSLKIQHMAQDHDDMKICVEMIKEMIR